MIKVEFTQEEFQWVVNCIDVAVKATGLQSVKSAAYMQDKLQLAYNESNKKESPNEVQS